MLFESSTKRNETNIPRGLVARVDLQLVPLTSHRPLDPACIHHYSSCGQHASRMSEMDATTRINEPSGASPSNDIPLQQLIRSSGFRLLRPVPPLTPRACTLDSIGLHHTCAHRFQDVSHSPTAHHSLTASNFVHSLHSFTFKSQLASSHFELCSLTLFPGRILFRGGWPKNPADG